MTGLSESNSQTVLRFNAVKFNPLTVMLFLLFSASLVVAILVFFRDKRISWEGPSVTLIPLAYVYAAFTGWHIEVTPEEITVVTFFWWRKSVRRAEITGWATKTGWKGGDRISRVPYRRLEIYTGKKSPPFMIFTKALKKGDLQKLIDLLPSKK